MYVLRKKIPPHIPPQKGKSSTRDFVDVAIFSLCPSVTKALPYDTSLFERANAGELGGLCYDKEERKLTPLLFVPASPRG